MFTENEKKFLKEMVKERLKTIKEEGDTIIHYPNVQFLAAEEKYEDFLEGLLKKL